MSSDLESSAGMPAPRRPTLGKRIACATGVGSVVGIAILAVLLATSATVSLGMVMAWGESAFSWMQTVWPVAWPVLLGVAAFGFGTALLVATVTLWPFFLMVVAVAALPVGLIGWLVSAVFVYIILAVLGVLFLLFWAIPFFDAEDNPATETWKKMRQSVQAGWHEPGSLMVMGIMALWPSLLALCAWGMARVGVTEALVAFVCLLVCLFVCTQIPNLAMERFYRHYVFQKNQIILVCMITGWGPVIGLVMGLNFISADALGAVLGALVGCFAYCALAFTFTCDESLWQALGRKVLGSKAA